MYVMIHEFISMLIEFALRSIYSEVYFSLSCSCFIVSEMTPQIDEDFHIANWYIVEISYSSWVLFNLIVVHNHSFCFRFIDHQVICL